MKVRYFRKGNMFLWFFFLSSAFSQPSREIGSLVHETEKHKDVTLKYIVPGLSSVKSEKPMKHFVSDILIDKNDEKFRSFMEHVEQGHAKKSLIFNIYDDNMREATIALFKMLHLIDTDIQYAKVNKWLNENINSEMHDYALRLFGLFNHKYKIKNIAPPFKANPHHFVNSETIIKALKLSNNVEHFHLLDPVGNQIFRREHLVSINTNYSGWILPQDDCQGKTDYFTEDVSLNSYYYGLSILHPFWMSNEELDEHNPRHAEHYYFAHRQLMSRYYLEEEHLRQSNTTQSEDCKLEYLPHLIHKNGLPFPVRSKIKGHWNSGERAKVTSTDMAIRECISRAMIVMGNGTAIKLNEDNYVDLIAKLVRANYDSSRIAKIVRSLFGYGRNGFPIDDYNPSPSLLHHPETTLRDPVFWKIIQYILHYFIDFGNTLPPLDMSKYETEEVRIVDASFSKLMTYFDYYTFVINKAVESEHFTDHKSSILLGARQKRLKHFPVVFNFTVESEYERTVIMRLFLGPSCNFGNCWDYFTSFYELDIKEYHLNEGLNLLSWTSERSSKFSYDDYFDMEHQLLATSNNYNIFKFPGNLILPRGLEKGLNMTLFVMFTSSEDRTQMDFIPDGNDHYTDICFEYDKKPLGFPFHRIAAKYRSEATNYKFYNISIYHKSRPIDDTGYFSSHLY